MAMRNIVTKEQELLRKKSRPVEKFDEKLAQLVEDMIETMNEADGVGLAAPQVGLLRRVVVIDVGEGPMELVNPEILSREGEEGRWRAASLSRGSSALSPAPTR